MTGETPDFTPDFTEADLTGVDAPRNRRRPKAPIMEIDGRKLKPATLMMGHGLSLIHISEPTRH